MKKTQVITPMMAVLCSLLLLVPGNVVLWGQQVPPPGGQQGPGPPGAYKRHLPDRLSHPINSTA